MKVGIFTDTYTPEISGVVASIRTLKRALAERVFRRPSMPLLFEKSLRKCMGIAPGTILAIKDYIHYLDRSGGTTRRNEAVRRLGSSLRFHQCIRRFAYRLR
jgi:hypothetical protein